jgi:glycerophosphoryl diester phosphodiesterase
LYKIKLEVMEFIKSVGEFMGYLFNEQMEHLKKYTYAHRGLHNGSDKPENSLAAFKAALDKGMGIEFDVHLMQDGELAVIHDSELFRTTGEDGMVEDLSLKVLHNYRLSNGEQIPVMREVLKLFKGKIPLIIELKTHRGNWVKLSECVLRELKDYKGRYCIESFDPRVLLWFKKHAPDMARGQLAKDFRSELSKIPAFIMGNMLFNCITKPDFIAYKFEDRHKFPHVEKQLRKLTKVYWTLKREEDINTAQSEDAIIIMEQN